MTVTAAPTPPTAAGGSPADATGEQQQQQQRPPPPSWTGDVWIQDEWTEEDKSRARDQLDERRRRVAGGDGATAAGGERGDGDGGDGAAFREFRRNASTNWNGFYRQNATKFFKDRHYLHKSFPREFGWLYPRRESEGGGSDGVADDVGDCDDTGEVHSGSARPPGAANDGGNNKGADVRIVEIGCGVGNAILPLLEQHSELSKRYSSSCSGEGQDQGNAPPPKLHIHCLDFAPTAIKLLKEDERFRSAASEGRATAHVYDLSSMHPSTVSTGGGKEQTLANSADVAILLFCLSAIGPHHSPALSRAARHVIDMLRPGGTLVLRDYGRLDEAQMKLGAGDKELGDNFYRKGDGTGCYYFELDDLKELFVNQGGDSDKLELLELDYIQRVYRNRADETTRRRVWVQGRFRKPIKRELGAGTEEEKRVTAGDGLVHPHADDVLNQFLDSSVDRWNDYYADLSNATPQLIPSLPSNLFQIFPNDFRPWMSLQPSSGKKGRRADQSQPDCELPTPVSEVTLIELGCGTGNSTLLDLIETQQVNHEEKRLQRPILNVHFVDASFAAIQCLRSDQRYQRAVDSKSTAAAVTSHEYNLALPEVSLSHNLDQSADIILLLFTLSAIGPYHQDLARRQHSGMLNAVRNAANMLKEGGTILFRDYGRYDDDQLQLNSVVGAQLCDNFYVRNTGEPSKENCSSKRSGLGCYFFELDEVRELFTSAGLEVLELCYIERVYKKSGKNGRDNAKNGGASNRTRVWIHGRFCKRSHE